MRVLNKHSWIILSILLVLLIILFWILSIAIHMYTCKLQIIAANTNPYTPIDKMHIFYGSISYLLVFDNRLLILYILILFVNMYFYIDKIKDILILDIKYLIIPLIIINVGVISSYYAVIFSEKILIDINMFLYTSFISTLIYLLFGAYASIYHFPRYIYNNRAKRLATGLSISIVSSIIALITYAIISMSGDQVVYKCSSEGLDIIIMNPKTSIIEASNTVTLSLLIANTMWFLMYVLLYYLRIKKTLSS
jgi:hypothetical protein